MSDLTLRIRPDKIGSVCSPFGFGPYLNVSPTPECREGTAVVAKVLSSRSVYGDLELVTGRGSKLVPGDIMVGVLGNRAALKGFSGRVPQSIEQGSVVHLLNTGGVIGESAGTMVGLGDPIRLEVIGSPLLGNAPARLSDFALPPRELPSSLPPLFFIAGTCMNSGKSTAAAVAIRHLHSRGLRLHAGKASGVAAIRDPLAFRDHGAAVCLSFLDCGVPSTAYRSDVPTLTKSLIAHLAENEPDAIILELGDGLMGAYGVDEILEDGELSSRVTGVVLAANDVVGAWAATERIRTLGLPVTVVTGPATDNVAGAEKLRGLGVPAANIMREPEQLCQLVDEALAGVTQ